MESSKTQSDAKPANGRPPLRPVAVTVAAGTHDDDDDEHKDTGTTSMAETQPVAAPLRPFPRGLRRLRDRLQMQDDGLRFDVNSIQQEIVDLNVQRLVLNTKRAVKRRLLLQKSVEVVVEYFGAFQHGWILEAAPTNQHIAELQASLGGTRSFSMQRSPRQDSEQAAFLRERQRLLMDRQQHFVATALDPAMVFGPDGDGVDAFVADWKKFSEHHRLPRLTLTCVTCHGSADEPIVIALGTFSGTLMHKALEEKYPRGLSDPQLMERLVGAAIQYPSREIFYFSNTGLITRYDRGLDYVCAFAHLLGNLEDVSSVLHETMLSDNGSVKRQTRGREGATPVLTLQPSETLPRGTVATKRREDRDVT